MGLAEAFNNNLLKFQLNSFGALDKKFIKQTLLNNSEGILNLSSKIDDSKQQKIKEYLCANYEHYWFRLEKNPINPEIYFGKSN